MRCSIAKIAVALLFMRLGFNKKVTFPLKKHTTEVVISTANFPLVVERSVTGAAKTLAKLVVWPKFNTPPTLGT